MSTKVHGTPCAQITVQRTTFASRLLTKVRRRPGRCDTGHDDLHCSQRISSVVTPNSIKTAVAVHRTRIARKSGARQTSFLAHLGSVLISKPVCGEVSTHEPRGNDPANAREKDTRRRQCVEKTLDNTSDVDKIAVTEHPTRIARTTSARWTSFCMHLGFGSISKQTCQNVAERTRVC